ncbi:hypothetical protein J8F10_10250 [Gemmata sp. G18]|uniref:histidine kinase n=1 Tax=Gemmata palustris TaxID=2822762 RepID=A0ABS5BPS2_9BACT|nr:ATP-binding protein [Gemmata palustris]MBP3955661.1 hypothetical protein [Gemmata palustris]
MLPPLSPAALKAAAPDPDPLDARAEEYARQAQKMEALGRVAVEVAHDFNNLLTAINGFAELVADLLPEDSPAREPARQIRLAGQKAVALTQQLVTFGRPNGNKPPVDLNDVLHELAPIMDRLVGPGVVLAVAPGPELWVTGADAGSVEQVILNLCANARDAMPGGGQLCIETANVAPEDPGGIGYVLLAVTDTGEGMATEVRARLFEPFYTTKPPARGSGLGLATVFGVVQRAGGRVNVSSQPGRGTRFEVYLPRKTESASDLT